MIGPGRLLGNSRILGLAFTEVSCAVIGHAAALVSIANVGENRNIFYQRLQVPGRGRTSKPNQRNGQLLEISPSGKKKDR